LRAAVYHGPGDVRIEAMPEPVDPVPGEVLLRVARAAICGTDASEYAHGPRLVPLERRHPASGHVGPLILGHEFVGVVEAVGDGVEDMRPGHRVVPGAGVSCGTCEWCAAGRTNLCSRYYTLGLQAHGGLAEYVRSPAAICRTVPDGCSDDAAAMAQPFAVALHALRRGGVGRGRTVAVIGVGGIGAFIVAGAKARGASPLIAVDVNDRRLDVARALGADHVVDARSGGTAEQIRALTGDGADVVVEASGAAASPAAAVGATKRGGEVVLVGLQTAPCALDLMDMALREVNLTATLAHVCDVDLPEALELLAGSEIARIVLDRVIPLDALVEHGLVPLVEGSARGKILVDTAAP
jgi:(R,R)-butanediol dehydrogenase/meso-butanediol dehydrogenase/diacetyl reductase